MSEVRVMLVDDSDKLRSLYRMALELDRDMRVVAEAADGQQALAAVGNAKPDVVLLDLSMPHMDGLETIPRLKRAAPASRIVVLTGFKRERLEEVAMALGASAFLEKGVMPTELCARLHEVAAQPAPAYREPSRAEHDALLQRARELI